MICNLRDPMGLRHPVSRRTSLSSHKRSWERVKSENTLVLLKRRYSAKETYKCKEPTHRSHPICATVKWSITSNKFVLTQKELRTSEIQKYARNARKKCCLPSMCLLSLWIHVRVCVCVCVWVRDSFHWNCYTPKIHQIQKLRFLCISLHIRAEILV